MTGSLDFLAQKIVLASSIVSCQRDIYRHIFSSTAREKRNVELGHYLHTISLKFNMYRSYNYTTLIRSNESGNGEKIPAILLKTQKVEGCQYDEKNEKKLVYFH